MKTKEKYGIKLIGFLAKQDKPATLEGAAVTLNLPYDYLAQVAGKLRRGGLIQSKKGPNGGYTLTKPIASITLGDVAKATGFVAQDAVDAAIFKAFEGVSVEGILV